MSLKRLVPGAALRRAASSPRHRMATRPRRAAALDMENGSAFMIVLSPRERANREPGLGRGFGSRADGARRLPMPLSFVPDRARLGLRAGEAPPCGGLRP